MTTEDPQLIHWSGMGCTNPEGLMEWCAAVPGELLDARRSELFWRYLNGQIEPAVTTKVEEHLGSCQECKAALETERLLVGLKSAGKVAVANCPSSDELLQYLERDPALGPFRRLEIKSHLTQCPLCREETSWAQKRVAQEPARPRSWSGWFSWNWSWAAATATATLVVFALIYPSQFGSRRFASQAQVPDIPYEAVVAEFATAHPDDLPRFRTATQLISLGEYGEGGKILRDLESRHAADPSIVFFRGYVAVREGRWKEATLLCTRAETRSLDGFRCWYLANVALKAGDLDLARKEIRHAKGHAPYTQLAQRLEKMVN